MQIEGCGVWMNFYNKKNYKYDTCKKHKNDNTRNA